MIPTWRFPKMWIFFFFLSGYTVLHTTSQQYYTNGAKTCVKLCFTETLLDSSFVPHDVAPSEMDDVNQD